MNNVPPGYKQTEVGVIPEEWEVRSLGALATMVASGRSSAGRTTGNYPVHGSTGIIGYTVDPEYEGDAILAARVGANAGKLNFVSGKYGVTDNTIMLRLGSSHCLPFFWRQLETKRLNRLVFGSGQPLITGTQLKALPLAIPPLPEQRAIATALSDVDALLGALDRLIAKKRDLKQAAMQQLLTGQTRLPGFHGEWEVKQLEQSCELITKGTTPTSIGRDFTEGGVNFLKAESISESGEPLVDKVAFIDAATNILLKRSQLKEGDLLISIAGVLGRVGRVSKEILPANTNQALALIRLANASELERDFLFYCLRSPMTTKQISDVNVQAAQANISLQNVRDLEIRVPPTKTEQTAIAAVLTEMDAELAALEQRREKTRALKQGMMQELLTGRVRLIN